MAQHGLLQSNKVDLSENGVVLTSIHPYGLVNYYPSLILLNKVNVHWVYVIMIALVDMIYGVIGAFLWQRGLKRYNGSGS